MHHEHSSSALAFFLGKVGSNPPQLSDPQQNRELSVLLPVGSLCCPSQHNPKGLWRLSGPYSAQGHLHAPHRLPSYGLLLDSLHLPWGAREKPASCLQLPTALP